MKRLDVTGMTCGHCVRAVSEAVREVDSAAALQIDLKADQVWVESTVLAATLEEAIREAGCEVRASAAALTC